MREITFFPQQWVTMLIRFYWRLVSIYLILFGVLWTSRICGLVFIITLKKSFWRYIFKYFLLNYFFSSPSENISTLEYLILAHNTWMLFFSFLKFFTFFSLHFNLYNFYYFIFKYFDSSLCLSLLMISHKVFFIFDFAFFNSNTSISLFPHRS